MLFFMLQPQSSPWCWPLSCLETLNPSHSMSLNLIEELLLQLKPAIKSQRQVRPLLEQFWSDKIALLWTSAHVHRAANEQKTVLTEAQARKILHDLHAHYDRQYGLAWENVAEKIQDSGLERDIKKRELERFINQNVVVVEAREQVRGKVELG